MRENNSSDPLPFIQLDRAAKAKAAVLAGALGVTTQHAVGSLIEFWGLNADPRELERLVEAGTDEVVLSASQVKLRFQLASGQEVAPDLLAMAGFLEQREGDQYRVRGMSRYFKTITRRVNAKKAASAGGKARMANANRNETGQFLPANGAGALAGESPASEPSESQPVVQARASRQPADKPASNPADSQPTSQVTEVRDQRSYFKERTYVGESLPPADERPPKPPDVTPPSGPVDDWQAEDFWRWAQFRRQQSGLVVERMPHPSKLSAWWSTARGRISVDGLRAAFNSYGNEPYWATTKPPYPFAGFMDQWDRHVTGGANAARA